MAQKFQHSQEVEVTRNCTQKGETGQIVGWSQRRTDGGFSYVVELDRGRYGMFDENELI